MRGGQGLGDAVALAACLLALGAVRNGRHRTLGRGDPIRQKGTRHQESGQYGDPGTGNDGPPKTRSGIGAGSVGGLRLPVSIGDRNQGSNQGQGPCRACHLQEASAVEPPFAAICLWIQRVPLMLSLSVSVGNTPQHLRAGQQANRIEAPFAPRPPCG